MNSMEILKGNWELAKIIRVLKKYKDHMKKEHKVKQIGIFGSYLKNEQKIRSDLDILVEFKKPVGLGYFELKDFLEEILKIKVDLVIKKGIKSRLREKILKDAIYI